MTHRTVQAPAKINLGLEILGRRDDGYHEIRTVMVMLDLCDTLTVFVDKDESDDAVPGVAPEQNLIRQAIRAFQHRHPAAPPMGWRIEKRIPAAAGLGGASSDAAAALLAANDLSGSPLERPALATIAAALGSDIPFFLGSPAALATGRGTNLTPIAAPPLDLLVIVPPSTLTTKTASMYGALLQQDFTSGDRVTAIAEQLGDGRVPWPQLLHNAFTRAAQLQTPAIARIWKELRAAGVEHVTLSGAGPAIFAIAEAHLHDDLIETVRKHLTADAVMISTTTRQVSVHIDGAVTDGLHQH